MRSNDRGTESRLGMGHRGLDEEGEKEHSRQKERRVQEHQGAKSSGSCEGWREASGRKAESRGSSFGVELEEAGCTGQVLASFIGVIRVCFLSYRRRERVIGFK